MASILISIVSLVLSLTVAWLTLFRRGNLGMTQPMLIGFLYENDQPKIFLRAMLYATGKRGHIIEALYLKVRRGEPTQTFNFWMYGETKELKIGIGLRVGKTVHRSIITSCRRKMLPLLRFLLVSTSLCQQSSKNVVF
jgi:hypothetical protein